MTTRALLLACVSGLGCGQVQSLEPEADAGGADLVDAAPELDAEVALACAPRASRTAMMDELGGFAVVEAFEKPAVAPATVQECFGPLSAATSAPCAAPNDLAGGFTIADEFNNAAVYGDGFFPNAFGRWVGPQAPDRAFEIRFDQPRTHVGFDLVSDNTGNVTVIAFDEVGTRLTTEVVTGAGSGSRFAGTSCNEPAIARILVDPDFGLTLADMLVFDTGN